MQRISFNMAVKRHMFPIGKQIPGLPRQVTFGTCRAYAIIVRADSRDSSRVSRSSSQDGYLVESIVKKSLLIRRQLLCEGLKSAEELPDPFQISLQASRGAISH